MPTIRAVLLSLAALTAADRAPTQDPTAGLPAPTHLAAMFPTPIHTAPDDPDFGAYGHWSAGLDHKVSFGQQVTFYPLLGAGHAEHLPLAWRSRAITADGAVWRSFEDDAEVRWDERRWALVRGPVVERWDMCERGVEQSFVLYERPARGGELVLYGAIDTPLRAAPRAAAHAPIDFVDDRGRPIVRYGEAFAFDADGHRIALGSSFDGEAIGLHVPGAWLATARLPVTIDPLLSRVGFGTAFNSVVVEDTDVAVAVHRTGTHTACCVYSRRFTDNDVDAYGLLCDQSFGNRVQVWQDVATFDTLRPRVAYCSPVDHFVIAFERRSSVSSVRLYRHSRTSTTLGSGTLSYLANVSGQESRRPDIGGVDSAIGIPKVLVAFEREVSANPADATVWAVSLDCLSGAFGTPFQLQDAAVGPARLPSVTAFANGDHYGVAWHTTIDLPGTPPPTDWLFVTRADFTSELVAPIAYGVGLGYDSYGAHVDGDVHDRLVVAFSVRNQTTFQPRIDRLVLDWSDPSASIPDLERQETLVSGTIVDPVYLGGIAWDLDTRSHWCIVHRSGTTLHATRLGWTGGVVEQANLGGLATVSACSVAFTPEDTAGGQGRFPIYAADESAGDPTWATAMTYPTTQLSVVGPGCHGAFTIGGPIDQPYLGNGKFSFASSGLSPNAIAVFAASTVPVSAPVPGAPGCTLYVDPATLFFLRPQLTDAGGHLVTALPLGEDPSWLGDVWLQVAWLDPSLNALGLGFGSGVLLPIR